MLLQIATIFINVTTPVFSVVLIGYLAGTKLGLNSRTLSRYAYYVLVPAFTFNIISDAKIESALALRMIGYIVAVYLCCALLGLIVGLLLRRPAQMVAAYVLIAVFANVGNFGLPLIEFRLGVEAIPMATVYFLAVSTLAFIVGVLAANWNKSGKAGALLAVFKTPALLALVPALIVNGLDVEVPLFLTRITALLAGAMIPTMLVTLGVQLSSTKQLKITHDTVIASSVRLIGGPLLAMLLIVPFGLSGIEGKTGIFQASMPAAVLASIIAIEFDLLPDFVTTTVLFTTLASMVTLTLVMALV